jgi:hypothetical protein
MDNHVLADHVKRPDDRLFCLIPSLRSKLANPGELRIVVWQVAGITLSDGSESKPYGCRKLHVVQPAPDQVPDDFLKVCLDAHWPFLHKKIAALPWITS